MSSDVYSVYQVSCVYSKSMSLCMLSSEDDKIGRDFFMNSEKQEQSSKGVIQENTSFNKKVNTDTNKRTRNHCKLRLFLI